MHELILQLGGLCALWIVVWLVFLTASYARARRGR
jgi:hypothetical protein